MDEILNIERMFSGGGSKQKDTTTTEDLINMAKKKGIKTPKRY